MAAKEQFEYTCDACGVVTVVEREANGNYGWPKTWQRLESTPLNLSHICTACVTSFKAWLKQRREKEK